MLHTELSSFGADGQVEPAGWLWLSFMWVDAGKSVGGVCGCPFMR